MLRRRKIERCAIAPRFGDNAVSCRFSPARRAGSRANKAQEPMRMTVTPAACAAVAPHAWLILVESPKVAHFEQDFLAHSVQSGGG
jgi:hypothetical protein